jgi:hypothetical protein
LANANPPRVLPISDAPDLDSDAPFPEMPRDSFALIELLDKSTPPMCVQKGQSLEEAQRYAGQRDLVEQLLNWKQFEQEGRK